MKDAARLVAYFVAVVLIGALLAPPLFWAGQWLIAHGYFRFLATVDFESFFHRSLILAAAVLLWPLLRTIRVNKAADLSLEPNSRWKRHLTGGFLLAAIPLFCCGAILIAVHLYLWRSSIDRAGVVKVVLATAFVPFVEEALFRGLILGILLRSGRRYLSMFVTSALYSIIHFLKAPPNTSPVVTWYSGFTSVFHAFAQFNDLTLVAAEFTTLFLIGWILADSRLLTRSLWLPIGLHAGWIFSNGLFNRLVRRHGPALPWLGKNLLVGLVPLGVCLLTWLLVRLWLKYDTPREK